jgi:hypothetical protein
LTVIEYFFFSDYSRRRLEEYYPQHVFPVVYEGQELSQVVNGKIRPLVLPPAQEERCYWTVEGYEWILDP